VILAASRYEVRLEKLFMQEPRLKRWARYVGDLAKDVALGERELFPFTPHYAVRIVDMLTQQVVIEHRHGRDLADAERNVAFIQQHLDSMSVDGFEAEFLPNLDIVEEWRDRPSRPPSACYCRKADGDCRAQP
jgi:hypothetical protein